MTKVGKIVKAYIGVCHINFSTLNMLIISVMKVFLKLINSLMFGCIAARRLSLVVVSGGYSLLLSVGFL